MDYSGTCQLGNSPIRVFTSSAGKSDWASSNVYWPVKGSSGGDNFNCVRAFFTLLYEGEINSRLSLGRTLPDGCSFFLIPGKNYGRITTLWTWTSTTQSFLGVQCGKTFKSVMRLVDKLQWYSAVTGALDEKYNRPIVMNTRPKLITVLPWIIVFTLILGIIDWRTGYELNFFVFYFIPVSIAAWLYGNEISIFISIVSAFTWAYAHTLSGNI